MVANLSRMSKPSPFRYFKTIAAVIRLDLHRFRSGPVLMFCGAVFEGQPEQERGFPLAYRLGRCLIEITIRNADHRTPDRCLGFRCWENHKPLEWFPIPARWRRESSSSLPLPAPLAIVFVQSGWAEGLIALISRGLGGRTLCGPSGCRPDRPSGVLSCRDHRETGSTRPDQGC